RNDKGPVSASGAGRTDRRSGGRAGGDPVSERPRRHGADHRLSGADALSGVLEHRLRGWLDPRSGVVPEVSRAAKRSEAGHRRGAEMSARGVERHEDTKTRKSTLFRAFVLSWLSLA